MYERMKQYANARPRVRKTVAVFLIVIGFAALITPLTPGAFLLPVGLQILGIQIFPVERIKKLRGKGHITPSPEAQ